MEKRKFRTVTAAFAILIALIVVLLLTNSLRRSSHIVILPEGASATSGNSEASRQSDRDVVEITPQTVQTAISTLERPTRYIRSLTVKNFWSGGSGTTAVTTCVCDAYTRTDTDDGSGRVRHVITDGKTTYVWYNQSRNYYVGSAGKISADQEQHIPTYEDILKLKTRQIANADYRTFLDENCIYVETTKDVDGYIQEYWVSVGTGLLVSAERQKNGKTVYRMQARALSKTEPDTSEFTLPDGKILYPVKK